MSLTRLVLQALVVAFAKSSSRCVAITADSLTTRTYRRGWRGRTRAAPGAAKSTCLFAFFASGPRSRTAGSHLHSAYTRRLKVEFYPCLLTDTGGHPYPCKPYLRSLSRTQSHAACCSLTL